MLVALLRHKRGIRSDHTLCARAIVFNNSMIRRSMSTTSESSPSKKHRAVEAMEATEQEKELFADSSRVRMLLVDTEQLERDRALLEGAKTIILRGLGENGKNFWVDLPVEWKNHRDVALAALKHEDISVEDLPISLQEDRTFLISAVNKDSDFEG